MAAMNDRQKKRTPQDTEEKQEPHCKSNLK